MRTASPTAAPGSERRVAARRQPALETVCRLSPAAGSGQGLGLVWNLSTSGLSMFLHEPLQQGAVIAGELASMSKHDSLPITLRVVHVRRLMTGDYFLGAQFEKPLGPEQLQPFMGKR